MQYYPQQVPQQQPYYYGYGAPPPQTPRSGPGPTLGILSIIFGSLLVARHLLDLVSAASIESMPSMFGPLLTSLSPTARMPAEELRTLALSTAAIGGLMILMSAALLVTGIGLLRKRPWAWQGSKIWAWIAFPALVVRLVIWHFGIAPATAAAIASVLPSGIPAPRAQTMGFEDVWCVLLSAYPIVLLALLRGGGRNEAPQA